MHVPELLRLVIAASPRQAIKVDEVSDALPSYAARSRAEG